MWTIAEITETLVGSIWLSALRFLTTLFALWFLAPYSVFIFGPESPVTSALYRALALSMYCERHNEGLKTVDTANEKRGTEANREQATIKNVTRHMFVGSVHSHSG